MRPRALDPQVDDDGFGSVLQPVFVVSTDGRLQGLTHPLGLQDPGRPARICSVPPTLAAAPARAWVTNSAQSIGSAARGSGSGSHWPNCSGAWADSSDGQPRSRRRSRRRAPRRRDWGSWCRASLIAGVEQGRREDLAIRPRIRGDARKLGWGCRRT